MLIKEQILLLEIAVDNVEVVQVSQRGDDARAVEASARQVDATHLRERGRERRRARDEGWG